MTNKELVDKFLHFEQKYKLFEFQDENGIFWWDIVRYHVYIKILTSVVRKNQAPLNINDRRISKYTKLFKYILSDTFYLLKTILKKTDYICFQYRRNIDKNGMHYDPILQEPITLLNGKICVIDGLNNRNSDDYDFYFNTFRSVFRRFYKPKNKNFLLGIAHFDELISKEFSIPLELEYHISIWVNNFYSDTKYYNMLFSFMKPKTVLMVASGSEKGLMYVCKNKNIKTIEFQHGQINSMHMYYSYPKNIDYSKYVITPDIFCSFGSYWHKTNYPVQFMWEVGKSGFRQKKTNNKKNILVATHTIYMNNLMPIIKNMANKVKDKRIIVKLHPDQKDQLEIIRSELNNYHNVDVISDKQTLLDLLEQCTSMITIQSTSVYEALQLETKVFLYKKQDYDSHFDIFENKNLYLIDNEDDIIKNLETEFRHEDNYVFFEEFDKNRFLMLLDETNI